MNNLISKNSSTSISPKISVIVPVYNAAKYLIQCIDSILGQDFINFELLLIDDGSKDNSGLICDEYAQKDKRVKVFHKENGGVSSARNLGIDNSQGEFVVFIDSDDYVDSDYLTILMSGGNADLVVSGYINTYCPEVNSSYPDSLYVSEQISTCLVWLLNEEPLRVPWGKRLKLNILKNNAIYFDKSISFGEDTVFVQTYLIYCNTVALQNGMPYHYRVEQNKQSFFRHTLSSKEYIYTSHIVTEIYKKITQRFAFTCPNYYQNTNKYILIQYFRGIIQKKFTFTGYIDYKQTMKQMLPEALFSDRLYNLIYKLLQKKHYFFSFLILKFIFPLKVHFEK